MAATFIRAALVLATLSFGWGCGGKATDTGTDTDTDSTGSSDDGYATELVINEFMASNGGSYTNDLAGSPDWIELYNPTTEEISLEGYTITDDLEDPAKHALANGLVIEADGYLLLFAAGDDTLGDQYLGFALSADGEDLGLYAPNERALDLLEYGAQHTDTSAARIPDGSKNWEFVNLGTPGETNNDTDDTDDTDTDTDTDTDDTDTVETEVVWVPAGSEWNYLDDGSDQGTAWIANNFNDSAWESGAAPLGYGDAHVVTTVSYGDDSNAKHITTYFRFSFEVDDLEGLSELEVHVLRDDAAVVYLNEEEIYRDNITNQTVEYDTYADAAMSDTDETTYFDTDVDTALLTEGVNYLAVEIHQATSSSSDLGFDLELRGVLETRSPQR